MGHFDWPFEILEVDSPLLRKQFVDLGTPCNLCYPRWTKNDAREYGKTMGRDTLLVASKILLRRLVKVNIPLPNQRHHPGAIFDSYPLSMRVLRWESSSRAHTNTEKYEMDVTRSKKVLIHCTLDRRDRLPPDALHGP